MAGGGKLTAVVCIIECRNAVLQITELWRQFGTVLLPGAGTTRGAARLAICTPCRYVQGWHVRTAAALLYILSSVVRYAPMGCTPTG